MVFFKKEKTGAKRVITILGWQFTYYKGIQRKYSPCSEHTLGIDANGRVNAMQLFLRQRRFDLIFKYVYLEKNLRHGEKTEFFKNFYLEHIRTFNGFYEDGEDYSTPKVSPEGFLSAFETLFNDIKTNGFDAKRSVVPVAADYELHNGAHRVAACAFLEKDVVVEKDSVARNLDFRWFQKKGLDTQLADYAALQYVRIHPDAFIVNLHSVTNPARDAEVEAILERHGFIFYKKEVHMNFNGYVNLKKLSYGKDHWKGKTWIGGEEDDFSSACEHARNSMGDAPMRIYVFVCPDFEKVLRAKKEIRELYNIGNFSVHINDEKAEALELAQIYFTSNSLAFIQTRPYSLVSEHLDSLVDEMKKHCAAHNVPLDDVCGTGSTTLAALGLRDCDDFDFLHCGEQALEGRGKRLSNHHSQSRFYPFNATEIIQNPEHHFYYRGMKFIAPLVLLRMKQNRAEVPKDIEDCRLLESFLQGLPQPPPAKRKSRFSLYKKIKNGDQRTIVIFGFLKFSYRRGRK